MGKDRKKISHYPRVGLALGGGGARGLTQIGVLKVLVRENIPIDLIIGTSMGSIIGGTYAFLADIKNLERVCVEVFPRIPGLEGMGNFRKMPGFQKAVFSRIFHFLKELYILRIGTTRQSLVDNKIIKDLFDEVLGSHTFDDVSIPFAAVATDLRNGDEVIIRKGELSNALMASSAIPGIFQPVKWNGRLLVDGNVTSQVPVRAARKLGADLVIAVNVEASIRDGDFRNGIEILFQVDDLRAAELNQIQLAEADIVISPEIGHINWANFSKIAECIVCGEKAAEDMLPEIRKKMSEVSRRRWKRIFWPFSRKEPNEQRSVVYD